MKNKINYYKLAIFICLIAQVISFFDFLIVTTFLIINLNFIFKLIKLPFSKNKKGTLKSFAFIFIYITFWTMFLFIVFGFTLFITIKFSSPKIDFKLLEIFYLVIPFIFNTLIFKLHRDKIIRIIEFRRVEPKRQDEFINIISSKNIIISYIKEIKPL
ncbi:hypothetical protein SMONO_v1c03090 [Spiroplasma monobiae MQ-1]|uniref:Transmembrane protein n=1 Tax=Spiroplasma monobiae MQ-1 TaxID=1336748 RepID=A0A2K9LU13_SPISQ|nr:hypothetical protein SMONO_v1c03090 [Spiroplasma monobiae MQ-1]